MTTTTTIGLLAIAVSILIPVAIRLHVKRVKRNQFGYPESRRLYRR